MKDHDDVQARDAVFRRRSIRLQGYDYSQTGAYFVTICTQKRECLFGKIIGGSMQLNDAGRMVERWYCELENKFPCIQCDAFVCMPNHVHFILVNVGSDVGADLCVRPNSVARVCMGQGEHAGPGRHIGLPLRGVPLHAVVQWFKTMSTNEYIRGVKQKDWPSFAGKLWQRNYWEHIVRNEPGLHRIREYIHNNPAQWELDKLFVAADQQSAQ